jgi:acetyltransferase-like isoleucine patch superfamily enzyme
VSRLASLGSDRERESSDASHGRAERMSVLAVYRFTVRVRNKAFSVLAKRSFESFGAKSVLHLPVRIHGEDAMSLGDGVMVGPNSWLQSLDGGKIELGDGVRLVGRCTISAAREVVIENDVLIAGGVYISDHSHARVDPSTPIHAQGTTDAAPVRICTGAWIGQNAVILPGVVVGRNAVVAANAVVRHDVPDYGVAAGVPARIVK